MTCVGAFGVHRNDPSSALASVRYITGVLSQRESVALWIFPQGEMQHPDLRPIRIYGGAVNIARRLGRCALVPVALRYDFLREQAPDAFAYLGAPLLVEEGGKGGSDLPARLQSAMTHTADALRADVTSHNLAEYRRVLLGRGSVNAHWDGVRLLVRRLFGRNQYEL